MAVLQIEGFENSVAIGVGVVQNAMTVSYPAGRTAGGICLRATQAGGSSYLQVTATRPDAASSTLQVGMAMRAIPLTSAHHLALGTSFLQLREGTTIHVYLRQNATTGALEVVNGSGTVIATSTVIPNPNAWNHYALAATCHDTAGAVVVWANGVKVIDVTNVDTRNGGTGVLNNGYFTSATLGTGNNGAYVEVDDIFISDSRDGLGDCRVVRLLPNAAGDTTAWTPSAGANWDAVNDTSATDYVGTATAGAKDLYNLNDLDPALTVVRAVQNDFMAWKSDAGTPLDLREEMRSSGGVDAAPVTIAAAAALSTTATWIKAPVRNVDPNGDAWTPARLNGLQVGVSVP